MSYEIEYSKHALQGKNKYGKEAYLCWSEIESNNVFPKNPYPLFLAAGEQWEVISKICHDIAPTM